MADARLSEVARHIHRMVGERALLETSDGMLLEGRRLPMKVDRPRTIYENFIYEDLFSRLLSVALRLQI